MTADLHDIQEFLSHFGSPLRPGREDIAYRFEQLQRLWVFSSRLADAYRRRGLVLEKRAREIGDAKGWLEEQRDKWEQTARASEQAISELRARVTELERAKAWLEEQRSAWEEAARASEKTIDELRAWTAELEKAKAWLEEQRSNWEQTAGQLRARVGELETTKARLSGQVEQRQVQLDTPRRRVERCRRRWAYRVLARLGLMERLDGD